MNKNILAFEKDLEKDLLDKMYSYNQVYFPNDFKYRVKKNEVDEDKYGEEKEREFLPIYYHLMQKYNIKLKPNTGNGFLDKWFSENIKNEIDLVYDEIQKETDTEVRNLMMVVLSRTVRSCRATRHYDLATLKEPQFETYYCRKHKKICKPIMTIMSRFRQYSNDTINRIEEYSELKTNASYSIICGDSRLTNIFDEVEGTNNTLFNLLKDKKINGIFTSPPYVGNIDYHEQHAYAYELFDLERKDNLEIGPLFRGSGKEAQQSYVEGVSDVLSNCTKFMTSDYDIFVVANDKYNLYPEIASKSGMIIVNQFKRPVLNRTERDRNPYSEIIFHLKEA